MGVEGESGARRAGAQFPRICAPSKSFHVNMRPPATPPDIAGKFAASAWGKKLAARRAKAAMSDFDRWGPRPHVAGAGGTPHPARGGAARWRV